MADYHLIFIVFIAGLSVLFMLIGFVRGFDVCLNKGSNKFLSCILGRFSGLMCQNIHSISFSAI